MTASSHLADVKYIPSVVGARVLRFTDAHVGMKGVS